MLKLLLFLVSGFIVAIGGCVLNFICFKNNKVLKVIIDFVHGCSVCVVFGALTMCLNNGVFRLYLLCGYIIGFAIYILTLSNIFAKLKLLLYNRINKMVKQLSNTNVLRRIFK